MTLFAKKIHVSRSFLVKTHVGFLVLVVASLYSYYRVDNGKSDAFSIISYAAFVFMSLCLKFGFEVGVSIFFLGCLTVQLTKISWVMAFFAAFFCYTLIISRCNLDSQLEIEATSTEDCAAIRIDSRNGETQLSPSIGEFLGESISRDNQQQNSEEKSLSIFYVEETTDQDYGRTQSFPTETESDPQYPQLRRRKTTNSETEGHINSGTAGEKSAFLQACDLCKGPLLPSEDIYMYSGEAFCSVECREQQMTKRENETEKD